jgi:murein DD-endopeptidase MepM/ murein hydrolase activator NlpD
MTSSNGPEPSFDPRSWSVATPAAPTSDDPPPAAPRPPSRRGLFLAGGAVAGAAVLGGGGWLLLRGKPASKPSAAPASGGAAAGRRSLVIGRAQDLPDALIAAGLAPEVARGAAGAAVGALGGTAEELRVTLALGPGSPPALLKMELRRPDGSGVRVTPASGGFADQPLAANLQARVKVVRGEMDDNSFYSSAVAAGVTDSLIPRFAEAFAYDFDFVREIRPGDIFEAAFARRVDDAGEVVGAEELLYASLQTAAKSRALYRFQPPGEGKFAWFDGGGASIVRSLMRTPVEGARITSTFGMRDHPVLGYTRMHKGVDFGAPVGTPVYASGDGVVDFVGVHGGHGNYMRVRHSPTLETAYAHLSAYGAGMTVGTPVRQGQEIARSGNTGLSSGPHLHYEIIVGGEQVDPMTFQTVSGRRLQGAALASFVQARDRIDRLRAVQS